MAGAGGEGRGVNSISALPYERSNIFEKDMVAWHAEMHAGAA